MPNLVDNFERIAQFTDGGLKQRIRSLQEAFIQSGKAEAINLCADFNLNLSLLDAALEIKRVAGQINEIVHATGILLLLPYILVEKEIIEYLSLGAGNTGKAFDLETNYRVAEFKFTQWRGSDIGRQNTFFKDYYLLAEAATDKQRCLYVIGDKYPLKFLNGRRALKSVLSKDRRIQEHFETRYGNQFSVTSDYYHSIPKDRVQIVDVTKIIPNFATLFDDVE